MSKEIVNVTMKMPNIDAKMLKSRQKSNIIKEYQLHEKDTGSADVQVAILTKEIARLTQHLKKHPKDNHSRRGLLKMVSRRKKLLEFLQKDDEKRYQKVIKKLGLKK